MIWNGYEHEPDKDCSEISDYEIIEPYFPIQIIIKILL